MCHVSLYFHFHFTSAQRPSDSHWFICVLNNRFWAQVLVVVNDIKCAFGAVVFFKFHFQYS